jgi:hypothetical protein
MSRIPPASIRLTSQTFHSPFVGTSVFYYNTQLKQNLTLQKAIQKLGKNLEFLTNPTRRRTLSVLQSGLLPISTQLRAKQMLTLQFIQSHYWFTRKTMNCAQLFGFSSHSEAPSLQIIQRLCHDRGRSPLSDPSSSPRASPLGFALPKWVSTLYKRPILAHSPLSETLFMLLCIRQIIGKTFHEKSRELVTKCGNKKKILTSPLGTPLKSGLKRNVIHYTYHFFEQLNLEKTLAFDNYYHYPRVSVNRPAYDREDPPEGKDPLEQRLKVDHLTHQVKNNLSPRLLVCHHFNSPILLNLFSFVEGAFAHKTWITETPTLPTGPLTFQPNETSMDTTHKIGLSRLKSAPVFELLLDLNSEGVTPTIRPTISIRL